MRTNNDFCHLHYKLISFYNRVEKCLLRGMNWVFKLNSLRFYVGWSSETQNLLNLLVK